MRPGTQLVCVQQDHASNRPENLLNRCLVPKQSGTVWGRLGPPQAA